MEGVWVRDLCAIMALATAAATGVSGLIALFLWWIVDPRPWAWTLLRVGQAVAVGQAAVAGVRYFAGPAPDDGLYYLYAAMPVAIAFIAEQIRLVSADTVLESRGLEDAKAVGRLPEDQQQSVVLAIMRRELGVVAAGALTASCMALRAWGTV
jgi:hypothetical protein